MNDKERLRITKNTSEVLLSLRKAIDAAGGYIDNETLLNMSMMEFISHVCVPNGVRFTYVETKPVEEIHYDTEDEFENNVKCPRCNAYQVPHYTTSNNNRFKYYCSKCMALFGKRE